jgi:hypothetical protein
LWEFEQVVDGFAVDGFGVDGFGDDGGCGWVVDCVVGAADG